jgi:hypothetical protein
MSNEIERIIKIIPIKKISGPHVVTVEFYQTFREHTPMHLTLVYKTQRGAPLPTSFYEANFTLTPKPDKNTHNTYEHSYSESRD